jgi:hypothetical protein
MPVISATQEVEIRGWWFEASLCKKVSEILPKNKRKQKGLGAWLKW